MSLSKLRVAGIAAVITALAYSLYKIRGPSAESEVEEPA